MRESVRREKRRVEFLPQAGEAGRDASGAAVLPYGENLWGQEHYGEAGVRANMPSYDGFWPHRFLSANGIDNHAPDVADLLVNRQAHQVKTYRLNVDGLIRTLAYSHSRMSARKLPAVCLVWHRCMVAAGPSDFVGHTCLLRCPPFVLGDIVARD